MPMKELAINIIGYINKQFGLGEGTRANIRALRAANISTCINEFNHNINKEILDQEHQEVDVLSNQNSHPINIVQLNFDKLTSFIENYSDTYLKGKYNIGFWVWELERFPEVAHVYFDLFDEIWTPSNYSAESISLYSPIPVINIPHSIEILNVPHDRDYFDLSQDNYYFLTIFDYNSSIERKNPIGVIDAYELAFGKNHTTVKLVIKASERPNFESEKQLIDSRLSENASIIYIEKTLTREQIHSLIKQCDCFISLHRSEGFGLTMAEAMYLNIPVIATDYSGNKDFMNTNNGFLVKYKLVSAELYNKFSSAEDMWAEPDIEDAAEKMKFVFHNPMEANKLASRGNKDIQERNSPEYIGAKMRARLNFIQNNLLKKASGKDLLQEISKQKIEISLLNDKLESIKNLPYIQMKVKFKNFKNRYLGKDKKYIWE